MEPSNRFIQPSSPASGRFTQKQATIFLPPEGGLLSLLKNIVGQLHLVPFVLVNKNLYVCMDYMLVNVYNSLSLSRDRIVRTS